MKILICESNPLLMQLMGKELMAEQNEVRLAWVGEKMTSQLTSFAPDILITEVLLPHMNGFEFIHNARLQFPKMMIVVISSLSSNRLIELIFRLGADEFISKPFDPTHLNIHIQKAIQGKKNSFISNAIDYVTKI
ncbi:response regulator [Paludibacter jiangxiensis]|uniref:Response regulator receiver domain-containing protein n=1 Tax=Paludibacter jiangxiensis TaxID=681398 RepID=A0A161LIR9_9BACT|nr:response regulator [Paludibacter jiangxiensis]GAT62356.1 response regulator receiver domain-containing protein [Paludibacter jiangxiensis]